MLKGSAPVVRQLVGLHDLEPEHCRFPIGDVGDPGFGFCGRPRARGAYCETHAERCFQPPQQKHKL